MMIEKLSFDPRIRSLLLFQLKHVARRVPESHPSQKINFPLSCVRAGSISFLGGGGGGLLGGNARTGTQDHFQQ